jgi:uncharacterized protein (TIGR00645 family)
MKRFIRDVIVNSKWILILFYIGLIFAQVFYCVKFVGSVFTLGHNFLHYDENEMMLSVLALVDIVMIANLVRIIITGSYHAFVDRLQDSSENISSGYLKVKIGMSLVGVSSIHLLQAFINSSAVSDREIIVKCSIHIVFLVSTIGLSLVDYMHQKSKTFELAREEEK